MFVSIALAASLVVQQPQEVPASPSSAAAEILTPYQELLRAAREAGPPTARDEEPDQIRLMMRTDLDDSRFFNKPGATRAHFDRDWEHCRQIARRLASSRSNGAVTTSAFVHGGVIGGLLVGGLDAAFSERRSRRDIRRYCLLTRNWRMVEPNEAHRRRITALPRAERRAYIDRMTGAEQVEDARITDLSSFREEQEARPESRS